ncbi:GDP-fucose protein O-fucosyltransferase 1-like protein [Euroglyphus maynei]|uniref:GDP-fucose protein O-fucosyltransferase 1 n=1 Tax=Euroglyphus maynei TaxID=6958 RepID=A0A1Y3ASK8_EURMA|nr:GDP-fucose protein O-fucosyltransferase 1-like protein [Euroglyphus maynei]
MLFYQLFIVCFSILLIFAHNVDSIEISIDPNGYLLYCPCMGRFGNQAEQFLGTLQFARSIDRTLILPPFIEYVDYKVTFQPFEDILEIDPIREYHRVITMKDFLTKLSPLIWKHENRSITCYSARNFSNDNKKQDCNPFEGSPFKEFWYHLGVQEFPLGSLYYKPLHTDYNYANEWKEKFRHVPVLALVGAPSSFPTNSKAVKLSKYIYFTKSVMEKAHRYRNERGFTRKPYLAIHLRHGNDWIRACELIHSNNDLKQLFSSQQCFGDNDKQHRWLNNRITFDLCLHSFDQIIEGIKLSLQSYNNQDEVKRNEKEPIEHIYIATDSNNESLWLDLNQTLAHHFPSLTLITPSLTLNTMNGTFDEHNKQPHFLVDLFLLSHANAFIGNCISSFSAFVTRYRLHRLHFFHTTHFFAFHRPNSVHLRDEL